jgi:hypothetical protein
MPVSVPECRTKSNINAANTFTKPGYGNSNMGVIFPLVSIKLLVDYHRRKRN